MLLFAVANRTAMSGTPDMDIPHSAIGTEAFGSGAQGTVFPAVVNSELGMSFPVATGKTVFPQRGKNRGNRPLRGSE